jgi:integrase
MLEAKTKTARIHFTKDAINRIKTPANGRTYTYDQKARGLAICTTAAGTKTFYLYRKVAGRPERIRLETWPEMTVEQARRAATSHNGAIADGKNPADTQRVKRGAPTLGEVFDLFLELPTRTKSKRPKSAITIRNYRQVFNACLDDWRDRKLSAISKGEIERLHNTLGTERGHYMANRVFELIRALFNCAIDQDLYNVNPAARLRSFEEESRERFLHADELPRFWKALEAEPSEKIRDFIKLALFTGQRRMNCLQMKWADINLDRATWTIPQTKTGRHEVPLTAEAVKVLRRRIEHRGDSEYVFPGRHGRGHLQDAMRQ